MKKALSFLIWLVIAVLGVFAYVTLAVRRGEHINSVYILIAALCTYAISYRFYSKWIAVRVLMLNDRRATPCEVHDDGKDFVKTNKWIVFGHHFAAISGPGPLVGPVLAAQFGYLPGAIWILIGVALGGAVQDFIVLFSSLRRNGKSLAQMVKEELNSTAGAISLVAIIAIMIILLAVLALVVVKVLADSPWGVFTVGSTIPIAMFMGCYLRYWRPGKVMEASVIGCVLLLLAVWGGQHVHADAVLAKMFGLKDLTLAWIIIVYGLAASVLPVWLLLAPRDYLSTFMKLGTICSLAFGIFLVLPDLKMPALTEFASNGLGPVVAGKLFPFCFITIACGAISGFHTLISSGTTPKIMTREGYARPIGYGAMLLESLVAIMALVAACTLDPGVYFSINSKGPAVETVAKVTALGFPVTVEHMTDLAKTVGEGTLFGRTGGAATLAVGMANVFSNVTHGRWLDLWYHFAIMFEALFILTTLDAGTRVGRYLLQDVLGHVWKPLGDVKSLKSNVVASVLMVAAWGYFLIQGVLDPLGGINSLWQLFGIANQLLAGIALCLVTTVVLKMQLAPRPATSITGAPVPAGRSWYALVTLIPLTWLLAVTLTAGYQKIFHEDARIGFLSQAKLLDTKLPALQTALDAAKTAGVADAIMTAEKAVKVNRTLYFNNMLDAFVAAAFMVLVLLIVAISVYEWLMMLLRKRLAQLKESEAVWLPDYAVAEGQPVRWFNLFALGLALVKELSGESAIDRVQQHSTVCSVVEPGQPPRAVKVNLLAGEITREPISRSDAYVQAAEERFENINRCC